MDASNETQKVLAQQIISGTDSNHWWETTLDQLNPRELYERYSHFSKLIDLFHISQSKKIASASSMLAPTSPAEDVSTNFPPRKPFTFGHPSIESIANRFLNGNIPVIDDAHTLIEANRMVRINKVIQLYNEVQSQMDASNETQKVLAQ
ncbi:hypothetical protein Gotur_014424 [Gossypium turneri]